ARALQHRYDWRPRHESARPGCAGTRPGRVPGWSGASAGAASRGTPSRRTRASVEGSAPSRPYCQAGSANQQLRDLDPVERRPFAQLVTDHPEIERVGQGQVLANPADETLVLPLDDDRHRVSVLARLVPEPQPRAS